MLERIGLRRSAMLALALASAVVPATRAGASEALSNREIIASFGRVVFSVEHDVWTDPRVTKWTKPILIAVGGEGYERYLGFLEAKVDELAGLSGHPIQLVPFERANTLVVFTSSVVDDLGGRHRALFGELYGGDPALIDRKIAQLRNSRALCYFGSAVGPEAPYAIKFARVFISLNMPQHQIYHCILEELTQMMGLFNDSFAMRHSIFNDANNRRLSLPEHDQTLLRILYDRRIVPGMRKDEALPIVGQVLREIRPEGDNPAGLPPKEARLKALDDLLTEGAISADEYIDRREAILGGK